MPLQNHNPNLFSSVERLRNFMSRGACWGLLWSQFLLVSGLIGTPIGSHLFAVLLLADVMLIFSLRELIGTNVGRDALDLTIYSFIYWSILCAVDAMDLKFYNTLSDYADTSARVYFILFTLRIFWLVRVPNSEVYYAWPIIGPASWFFAKKSEERIVRNHWHSLVVVVVILLSLAYAFLGGKLKHEEYIKQALAGLIGFVLFFKFYRPFTKSNLALVDENNQYRTNEEKLATLIMAVQAQADGKLNPQLVKTMCHFAQLDDRTQIILAATIEDVAKSMMLPANQATYGEPPKAPEFD